MRRTWAPGAVFRLVLLAVLAWCVNDAFQPSRDVETDQGAISAARFQSGAMLNMPPRGRQPAARPAGPRRRRVRAQQVPTGQQQCRIRLRERAGTCLARVAQRYPARSGDTDHTPMIIGAYLQCLFEQ